MGQQDKQQNQKQLDIGDVQKKVAINVFDYQQFILIMQQGLQQQDNQQENSSQQVLHEFKCMILNHGNKQIEAICVNEECKGQNRRTCFDCIIQGEHDKDKDKQQQFKPLNADQLNSVIKNYKLFLNQLIDKLKYFFYYEQLELTNENNQTIACIKLQELQKIEYQLKYLQEIKDQINIKNYIEQQYNTNMGIFNYFLQHYKEIIEIKQNIEKYFILKKEIKNSQNEIENVKINTNEVERFYQLKKKKQIIIDKIIESSHYKNQDIDEKEQNFKKSQIAEISRLGTVLSNPNDQQNSDQYNNKGISLHHLQKYEEAIEMFDKAIQLNPLYEQAYINKGSSLDEIFRSQEAIQVYRQVMKLNPQNSKAYNNTGVSYVKLSRYEEACKWFDQATKLNPQYSQAFNNRGMSLKVLKRYEEAIEMYDNAIQLNPQYAQAYNNKGVSLLNLQRYEEAIEMYDKARQLDPQYEQTLTKKVKDSKLFEYFKSEG